MCRTISLLLWQRNFLRCSWNNMNKHETVSVTTFGSHLYESSSRQQLLTLRFHEVNVIVTMQPLYQHYCLLKRKKRAFFIGRRVPLSQLRIVSMKSIVYRNWCAHRSIRSSNHFDVHCYEIQHRSLCTTKSIHPLNMSHNKCTHKLRQHKQFPPKRWFLFLRFSNERIHKSDSIPTKTCLYFDW